MRDPVVRVQVVAGGGTPATHALAFREATDPARAPLVLLHGSDGTELDLMPLADDAAPGAARLGIRGTVIMEGGYGFFRRHRDRRVDEEDIATRAGALAQFIRVTCAGPTWTRRPVAIAYSNGAIMTAALMMTDPGLLAGAVLLRPLRPFQLDPEVRIDRTPVLVIDGETDARRSPGDGLAAADQLRRLGAEMAHRVLPGGHSITGADRDIVRDWLQRNNF